ncbi:MAG: putative porin [Candidatus Aureabacteria bacterium]|nr:putative porin [Candidatus Auribacterota bacterium]
MQYRQKLTLIMIMLLSAFSWGGEVDSLVNQLVDKGTLTASEGREIATGTQEEMKSLIAKGSHPYLPKWIQTMKMKGDFRFRYQHEKKDGSTARDRERLRFRFGIESKVNDSIKIVSGLATGGTDPRSTNQTLENNFEPKNINVDYCFTDITLNDFFQLIGGKMKNPLWNAGDLLWDGDINPEGVALVLSKNSLVENLDFELNSTWLVLDEVSGSEDDPYMLVIQPVFKWSITEDVTLKIGAAYYYYANVKGSRMDKTVGTNSGITKEGSSYTGSLIYKYDAPKIDIDFGVNKISDFIPYAGVFGEYLKNSDPSSDNKGYLVGIKFGHEKVKEPMSWQFVWSQRKLEKDACLDIFPDSDFYGGKTNVKGNEFIFNLGLSKNLTAGLDYYMTENLSGTIHEEKVIQADLVFKF